MREGGGERGWWWRDCKSGRWSVKKVVLTKVVLRNNYINEGSNEIRDTTYGSFLT